MQAAAERNVLAMHLVPGMDKDADESPDDVRRNRRCSKVYVEEVLKRRGDVLSMKQQVTSLDSSALERSAEILQLLARSWLIYSHTTLKMMQTNGGCNGVLCRNGWRAAVVSLPQDM